MAARGSKFIRVRLYFDYPPPAVVDCRMCWLLVDLNTCRVVADLESIIREKFEFSRRSILNLFIEDCYLPHTESIFVVRDNDSVRVKVEYLAQVNGDSSCQDKASESCRKRHRLAEEDGPEENGVSLERKKKKRKNWPEESEKSAEQAPGEKKKKKKKKKMKIKKVEEEGSTVVPKPAASAKNTPVRGDEPVKSNKKTPVAPNVSSSDSSSSSSEEEDAPKKTAAQKPAPKTPSPAPASSKAHPTTKPAQSTPRPPLPSTSDTTSSSDEATSLKPPPNNTPTTSTNPKVRMSDILKSQQAPSGLQSTNCAQTRAASRAAPPRDAVMEVCTSSSEEEIKLVIRRPVHQLGHGVGGQPLGRGRGRGNNGRGGPRGRGRGRGEGRGGYGRRNGSAELSCGGAKEPTCQTDSLTNTSVVLQNGAESAPEQDYSSMPLLAAPPQVGQKIAFKLLELTENYTPEVSEYKVGRILNFDHTTKQIDLELQDAWQAPLEPGKFDLVYQNPDGSERVEFAVSRDSRVTERWDSLLEPRLII